MSAQISSQFEQKNPDSRLPGFDTTSSGAEPLTGAVASAPGYGGYGAGYGNAIAGDSEMSLVHYLQVLYRRRYIASTAFLIVVLMVSLETFTAVRIYQASTRILIERDAPKVVSFQEVLEQGTKTDDYYETQYVILRGHGLARRTIDALNLWSRPEANQPPAFSVREFLMTPANVALGWLEPARPAETPDASETSAQSAVIDEFLVNLSIDPVRFSRLVDVSYRSPGPVLAAKVPNALALAYIQQNQEFQSTTTREASDFLTQQLAEQRKKVEGTEQALQAYRERTDSVSLTERENVVVQRLSDLNTAVTRANTIRIQKEGAYDQVKGVQENPAAVDSLQIILSNPFVQQQKTELAQLQRQRAQLSEKLDPNHPDMQKVALAIQNAEAKIQAEVAQIVRSIRSEYEAAVAEERRSRLRIDDSELVDFRFIVDGPTGTMSGAIIESNQKELDIDFWFDKHQTFARRMAIEEILRAKKMLNWSDDLQPRLLGNPDERMIWFKQLWYGIPLYSPSVTAVLLPVLPAVRIRRWLERFCVPCLAVVLVPAARRCAHHRVPQEAATERPLPRGIARRGVSWSKA